jgi:hypothetical protein
MKIARAKAMAVKTFTAQASLTIITYDHKNIFYSACHWMETRDIYRRFCSFPEPNIIKLLMAVTIYNMFCPL